MKNSNDDSFGEFIGPGEVRFIRLLPGPIERVWAYLTDPEKRARWFAGGPMELRAGGKADLKFRHANLSPGETPPADYKDVHDPGVTMPCTVTHCEPPRRLSFTWAEEPGRGPSKGSEVTFELTPEGTRVRLVLTHRRLATREDQANVGSGWHLHLGILRARLEDTPPSPFWAGHARLEKEYAQRIPTPTGTEAPKGRSP